jgi:hypothetical protein
VSPPPQVLPLHGMMIHVHHRFKDDGIHYIYIYAFCYVYEHAHEHTKFFVYIEDITQRRED